MTSRNLGFGFLKPENLKIPKFAFLGFLLLVTFYTENDVTEGMAYRMFFLGRKFVSGLCTLSKNRKKLLKSFKNLKT